MASLAPSQIQVRRGAGFLCTAPILGLMSGAKLKQVQKERQKDFSAMPIQVNLLQVLMI